MHSSSGSCQCLKPCSALPNHEDYESDHSKENGPPVEMFAKGRHNHSCGRRAVREERARVGRHCLESLIVQGQECHRRRASCGPGEPEHGHLVAAVRLVCSATLQWYLGVVEENLMIEDCCLVNVGQVLGH